eukprot:GSMAST32.ASY1.ANO1.2272.1 assembled CDS
MAVSDRKTLRLGDEIPDFSAESSLGKLSLYQVFSDAKGSPTWGILFSHPDDFTPVCTTELGVKLAALSCNDASSHYVLKIEYHFFFNTCTGRNFSEIIRVIDSLQLTKQKMLATPADWTPGEKAVLLPGVSTKSGEKTFGEVSILELPSKKEYIRFVEP